MSSASDVSDSSLSFPAVKAAYWLADEEYKEFSADQIDSTLFTHIFFSYTQGFPESSEFSEVTEKIRKINKDVKMLVSLGIKNAEACSRFASIINDPASRKSSIQQFTRAARALGFDGIDIDWEYPRNDVEMRDLGILLKEWRSALDGESLWTGQPRLLLTAAVFYSPDYKRFRYNVEEIADSVDWVNLIFYNFNKSGSSLVTGPPAALFNDPLNLEGIITHIQTEPENVPRFNVKMAFVPENKAVFGFSYVGWGCVLEDVNNHGYGAPVIEMIDTSTGYAMIRESIVDAGAAMVHDPIVVGDYCYTADGWIGYDDNPSIVKKVTYAQQRGLRGYFAWHLGADYKCGLSRAANQAWNLAEAANTKE